ILRSAAEDHITAGENHQLSKSIGGQFQLARRGVAIVNLDDAGPIHKPLRNWSKRLVRWQVDNGKRTKRSVVNDLRDGDGQNQTETLAKFPRQFAFEIDDVRQAIRVLLRIHAVVGGDPHDRVETLQAAQLEVNRGVEIERFGRFGREFVLNEVRRG